MTIPTRTSFVAALLLVLGSVPGCSTDRSYEVHGRIVGFGDDDRTVLIEHEDVPGLMPAMTMSFTTTEAGALDAVGVQDAVRFTLHVTRDSSWITDLVALPDSAVAVHPAGSPDPAYEGRTPLLTAGDPVPDAPLTDQHSEAVRLSDFEGQALVLTFIYTRCPLPEYCPLLSRQFKQLQPRLRERFGDQAHLLSISFDPADTPSVLIEYAARYTDDTTTWTFATGEPDTIAELAQAFGVVYEAEGAAFTHNLATALIGPNGEVRRIWRGNDWRPDAIVEAVEATLQD